MYQFLPGIVPYIWQQLRLFFGKADLLVLGY
jgi:hypothetical protein